MSRRTGQGIAALFVVWSCCLGQRATAAQPDLSDAQIQDILEQKVERYRKSVGIVVGIVTDRGTRVVSYGKIGDDDSRRPEEDTVYEIGSITKVFTAILLADMVRRGEVSLGDPISRYLPKSVKVPTKDGREITLLDLATHTSGLPHMPDNMAHKDPVRAFADYRIDQMYEFLSRYTVPEGLGTQSRYSNLGMALLGHVLALRAGTDYETLVRTRICEPLHMDSTRLTTSRELQARLAPGHDASLRPAPNMDLIALAGAGNLRSTTNDLLKFLAANLGLAKSYLTPVMQQTHIPRNRAAPDMEMGMGWYVYTPFETPLPWHSGGTWGYHAFIGIDEEKRIGAVVLSNSANPIEDLGFRLLGTVDPWAVDRTVADVDPKFLDEYVGVYELAPEIFRYVTRSGNRLFLQRTGGPQFEIFPETERDFFIKDKRIHLTFKRGSAGKVNEMVLWNYGKKDTAVKTDRPIPRSIDDRGNPSSSN